MAQQSVARVRDREQETWERLRYAFLEQLYLLTGGDCEHAVSPDEIEAQLEVATIAPESLIEDLARWGYLEHAGRGSGICITEKGIQYLRRDAWRRRSVRD